MNFELKKLKATGARHLFVGSIALVFLAGVVQAGPVTFETLTPQTTFLDYDAASVSPPSPADTPTDSVGILLTSLSGYAPGATITLSSTGDICFGGACGSEGSPTFVGVFSSSSPAGLAGQGNLQRVSNYMSLPSGAGSSPVTGNTFYTNLPTDIPEDFLIPGGGGVSFVVPSGAVSLYLGIADAYYKDNSDPNSGQVPLGVNVSFSSVPEPGTVGLMLTGLAGLLAFGRKRFGRS